MTRNARRISLFFVFPQTATNYLTFVLNRLKTKRCQIVRYSAPLPELPRADYRNYEYTFPLFAESEIETNLWIVCTVTIMLQSAKCSSTAVKPSFTSTTWSDRHMPPRRRLSRLQPNQKYSNYPSVTVLCNASAHPVDQWEPWDRIKKRIFWSERERFT